MPEAQRRDDLLAEWSRLHGGYDPRSSRLVLSWLRLVLRLAGPLAARRVSPMLVTLAAVVAAAAACPLAAHDRWQRLAASALVASSALLDGVDGALAIRAGRASSLGFIVDSVADRVSDALFIVALWLAGAPGWLAVAAGSAAFLLEYTRARAAVAGLVGIGVVTVGERPTRVILTVMTIVTTVVFSSYAGDIATAGVAATLAVAVVGLGQFLVVARHGLAASSR